jgi:phosphinothricin acetyltransferase
MVHVTQRKENNNIIVAISVELMSPADWPAVREIYAEGIAGGNATFETSVPDWESWTASKRADCRLVARHDGEVLGFAVLSPISKRAVYAGVAEVTVYVASKAQGAGIGSKLLGALVEASEKAGVWTLTASIFPENEASLHIHRKHGFQTLGRRIRIAQLRGQWRDTILMERRSHRVDWE